MSFIAHFQKKMLSVIRCTEYVEITWKSSQLSQAFNENFAEIASFKS